MNQERIGKFIKELRISKNLTQEELANKIGVTNKAVGNWENGRRLPDYSIINDLCDNLGISVNELFNGSKLDSNDGILNVLEYESKEKKKYKNKNIIIIIGTILVIIFSILFIYFVSNFNKVHIYSFSGENEHFSYSATFMSSNIKEILFSNKLVKAKEYKNIEIKKMTLKCEDRVIVGGSGELIGTFIENYGYSEMFSKKVLNDLDKWHIEIVYLLNGEYITEDISLNKEKIMDNNEIIHIKDKAINEDPDSKNINPNEDKIMERFNERVDFLLSHGYDEITPENIKERNILYPITIKRIFSKKLSASSSFTVEVSRDIAMYWYNTNVYTVKGNLLSRYMTFMSKEVGSAKKLYYIYNARDNMGRCHSKSCPDHFIREARDFFELYKKEFDGIYYFLDGEYSIYNEDGSLK